MNDLLSQGTIDVLLAITQWVFIIGGFAALLDGIRRTLYSLKNYKFVSVDNLMEYLVFLVCVIGLWLCYLISIMG